MHDNCTLLKSCLRGLGLTPPGATPWYVNDVGMSWQDIQRISDQKLGSLESDIPLSSVVDPDPHGSALIGLSWIRIRIGNADLDPDPGAWKLAKINKFTWLPASKKGFCTSYLRRHVFWPINCFKYIFHVSTFVTLKSDQDPAPDAHTIVTLHLPIPNIWVGVIGACKECCQFFQESKWLFKASPSVFLLALLLRL